MKAAFLCVNYSSDPVTDRTQGKTDVSPCKDTVIGFKMACNCVFHQVCSRDGSTLRKRTLSLSQRGKNKKGIFSSLKGLDTLARKGKEKRASITQVSSPRGRNRRLGEILDIHIWRRLRVRSVYLLLKVNSKLIQKNLDSPGTCTHVNYTNDFFSIPSKAGLPVWSEEHRNENS